MSELDKDERRLIVKELRNSVEVVDEGSMSTSPAGYVAESEMLSIYIGLINYIDDYLEYRYKEHTPDQMKAVIMAAIDEAAKRMDKAT